MATRRRFTPEEITAIQRMSAIRMPLEQMATVLGMTKNAFVIQFQKVPAVRNAVLTGRASASQSLRATLYNMAMGAPEQRDVVTGEVVRPATKPDFQALKFWCQTQEGFKITDKIELEGMGAESEQTAHLTNDDLASRVSKITERLNARLKSKKDPS